MRHVAAFLTIISWLFAATWVSAQASLAVIWVVRSAGLPEEIEAVMLLIFPSVALLGTWAGLYLLTMRAIAEFQNRQRSA